MSSFSENFQREDTTQGGNTQYDDSAFFSFASTMLIVIIIWLIISILRRLKIDYKYQDKKYKNCKCNSCEERLKLFNKKERGKSINCTFYFYIILTFFFCYLLSLSIVQVQKNSGKIKGFDPFEILEIEPGANTSQIKKAYKILALKYHPDKNPNDNQAKAKFMLINKAYESLTNEEAKKNFEKYGNPDGPGSMRVSIGLPSFVLEKKNHMPILLFFVVFIVIIFPCCFLFWYNSSESYNENGILVGNFIVFIKLMNENILLRQMPFVLGNAFEFQNLKIYDDEEIPLTKIYKHNKDYMITHKNERVHPANKKAICIYYSYLNREDIKIEHYKQDLSYILSFTDKFIDYITQLCIEYTQASYIQKVGKNFGYPCVETVLEFSQNMHQQISHLSNQFTPYLQLPYFNENKIRLLKRGNQKLFNTNKPTYFLDFLKLDVEARNNILSKEFSDEEISDINKAINSIPIYDLNIEVYTEGFEDIIVNDEISIKVTVTRTNLGEDQWVGMAHSLGFTEPFDEKVSITILNKKILLFNSIETIKERKTEHIFIYQPHEAGKIKLLCDMISLSYKGVNISKEFEYEVKKSSEKRELHLKDIEKREIKKIEPSFTQRMLSGLVPTAADDEDEEEEEQEDADKKDEKDKKDKKDKKDGENKKEKKDEEGKNINEQAEKKEKEKKNGTFEEEESEEEDEKNKNEPAEKKDKEQKQVTFPEEESEEEEDVQKDEKHEKND